MLLVLSSLVSQLNNKYSEEYNNLGPVYMEQRLIYGRGYGGCNPPYNSIFLLLSCQLYYSKTINNPPFLKILDPPLWNSSSLGPFPKL